MIRFLISMVSTAFATAFFLAWSRQQIGAQLDKMQEKAHFTPGADSPLPPAVALTGAGLLSLHFLLGQSLLRLRGWQALVSLVAGATAGLAVFLNRLDRETP